MYFQKAAIEESADYSISKAISAQIVALSRAQGCPYCWDRLHQAMAAMVAVPKVCLWP